LERGLIQVYTGDGKGKTTAAIGLAFRASGHGLKTYIIQFMKGKRDYGELMAAEKLSSNLTILPVGRDQFVNRENPDSVDIDLAQKGLARAKEIVEGDMYDILVLDEINVALDYKLVDLSDVMALIKNKPAKMEIVLTGRYAPKEIMEAADLVTEMREVKHYYKEGIASRKGIEW
jgi:cob(I)alamin adenosyltransferase